jgi:hypothetical protein
LANDALPTFTTDVVLVVAADACTAAVPLNRPETAAATIKVFIECFICCHSSVDCRPKTTSGRPAAHKNQGQREGYRVLEKYSRNKGGKKVGCAKRVEFSGKMDDLMSQKPQTYANHVRRQLAFHFFLIPVLILNLIYSLILLIRHPNPNAVWVVIMAIALLVMAFLVRINPIKVQDRLIRLEERMRLATLLSEPLRSRIPELKEKQLVALRFASNEEIPALVEETLRNDLKSKEIKKKIRNWRSDNWRV